MINNFLIIKGAKEKNLKNIDVKIPKNKLVIFTGVSGSGKTSLAFSTIYNEGKRKYIESLSTYARQFLGNTEKPDVDQIIGLSPTVAINQKTSGFNPRSIVGTVTEIYDYLRLLYARTGDVYCINGHGKIETLTLHSMLEKLNSILLNYKKNISIFAPIVSNKKGSFKQLLLDLKRKGFWNILINGEFKTLDENINLKKTEKQNIWILIENTEFNFDESTQNKIYSDLEIAKKYGNGNVIIRYEQNNEEKQLLFSTKFNCKICSFGLEEIEPSLFSFNTIEGACSNCKGLGNVLSVDWNLLVPNDNLTINQGGINFYKPVINKPNNWDWKKFKTFCEKFNIDMNKPIKKLTKKQIELILNGSSENIKYSIISKSSQNKWNFNHPFIGIKNIIEKKFLTTKSESIHYKHSKKYLYEVQCLKCKGSRLKDESLCVYLNKKNIFELSNMTILDSLNFIKSLKFNEIKRKISKIIIVEIKNRLSFLISVGLDYLTLNRSAKTLSGGESQRIRLATQIGSNLTGIIYVLDEPSIGLHQYDNKRLIDTLKSMRDLGNTVIVVEHDEETMRNADWIVDIGPYGGAKGGEVIYSGTFDKFKNIKNSITSKFIDNIDKIEIPKKRRKINKKFIKILKASENNLNNIDIKLPLNKLICITGISGSGKSTLLNEIIYKGIKNILHKDFKERAGKFKDIKNVVKNIEDIVFISQKPIGKTSRSNPATYVSVFDHIRLLFANTIESRKRGYTQSRFSFNVEGGRCEKCKGDGNIYYSMLFLPDVSVKCDECHGKKYNSETLEITYKAKNIYDILQFEISSAIKFFENYPKILKILKVLDKVGLGYITLGQPSTQLSGGESQRIKLSKFLQKKPKGKTLYLLDEPTTGLHTYDIKKLLNSLNGLVNSGETVILIEHNLDVIKFCDYIIDLGPFGGKKGGNLVCSGTPEEVSENKNSLTGKFLKKILKT